MFVYHGFRYVEISGLPEGSKPSLSDFTGLVLYDQMATTSTFETDNDVINAVHRNAFWGIRGNYRSMPTDCPQRDERMGWTGDRTTGNYGESYIFNNHQLYAKWLTDAEDSQWENGSLPNVIPPYWRGYTDNMTWPGAVVTVADMLYTRFGDLEPIRQHYDAMKKWLLHRLQFRKSKQRKTLPNLWKRHSCLPSTSLSSTTISAVTYSAVWLSTRNPMSLTRSMPV